jgi:hypothetical protein
MCITCTFNIIHSYLFGLNINLHIKQPHNALNPCTQSYTNITKYSSCKLISCTCFHVNHGHIKLPDPSPKDLAAILMKNLIEILNTELPSWLRACSHSHDIHMESLTNIVITMSPFPYDNNQQEGILASTTIKLFNNPETLSGQFQQCPRQQGNLSSFIFMPQTNFG